MAAKKSHVAAHSNPPVYYHLRTWGKGENQKSYKVSIATFDIEGNLGTKTPTGEFTWLPGPQPQVAELRLAFSDEENRLLMSQSGPRADHFYKNRLERIYSFASGAKQKLSSMKDLVRYSNPYYESILTLNQETTALNHWITRAFRREISPEMRQLRDNSTLRRNSLKLKSKPWVKD